MESRATFLISPGSATLVIPLDENIVVTSDFPTLIRGLIEKLPEEERKRAVPMAGCNIACNPLVCGGLVIQ